VTVTGCASMVADFGAKSTPLMMAVMRALSVWRWGGGAVDVRAVPPRLRPRDGRTEASGIGLGFGEAELRQAGRHAELVLDGLDGVPDHRTRIDVEQPAEQAVQGDALLSAQKRRLRVVAAGDAGGDVGEAVPLHVEHERVPGYAVLERLLALTDQLHREDAERVGGGGVAHGVLSVRWCGTP